MACLVAHTVDMTTETLPYPDLHPDLSSAGNPDFDPRPLFVAAVDIATPDRWCPDRPLRTGIAVSRLQVKGPRPPRSSCIESHDRPRECFAPGSLGDPAIEHVDYEADWLAAGDVVDDVWSDDALLARTVVLPWATMTGAEVLAMYVSEITTHTWDIAKATGQNPKWDNAVCQLSLDTMHRDLPMADRTPMWEEFKATAPSNLQFDPPFANAVAVGTDAPLIDQLVAWTGRQP
jgi:hypothetical protein